MLEVIMEIMWCGWHLKVEVLMKSPRESMENTETDQRGWKKSEKIHDAKQRAELNKEGAISCIK
jgi:hypothetical protein